MGETEALRSRADALENRLIEVRKIKHQISNELMGVMGHTELMLAQHDLPDKVRDRAERIRAHCENLQQQALALNEVCTRSMS